MTTLSIPRLALLSAVSAALLACSSVDPTPPSLLQARQALSDARSDPQLQAHAAAEMAQAQASLRRAEEAQQQGERARVEHQAYLAQQGLRVAQATAAQRVDQVHITQAGAERERMRLDARTLEADRAQRDLRASQQTEREQGRQLADIQAQLSDSDRRAQAGAARVDTLEQELIAMQGRGSPQGVIVTLGDLLFASGSHEMSAESPRLRQLAALMRQHPRRAAVISGYTDNQGGADANQRLSERRAHSVMAALVGMGIAPTMMRAEGHGEAEPVADNHSVAGRQLNRRVEVLFAAQDLSAKSR